MQWIRSKQKHMAKVPAFIDANALDKKKGSGYPHIYRKEIMGRARAKLGDQFGLTQFGVNMVTLDPGSWSSHRHWHAAEDEFIHVIDGEVTLVNDEGAHILGPGMCAGFKAGSGSGHQLQNNSTKPCTYLEVGTRAAADEVTYSDIDMKAIKAPGGEWRFTKRDGTEFLT
jgi:uncharacterized cupin superfamily protein